jgi:hypothetical protein
MQKCLSLIIARLMSRETLILLGFGIWLLILSLCIFLIFRFFRRLIKGKPEVDLRKILDKILTTQEKNTLSVNELDKKIRNLEDEGLTHVQKIGLVRFNPFEEIGGDHSFSLSLLDGKDSGVVITGLHTRERTRLYIKSIRGGKCEAELSTEEKKALTSAQKT